MFILKYGNKEVSFFVYINPTSTCHNAHSHVIKHIYASHISSFISLVITFYLYTDSFKTWNQYLFLYLDFYSEQNDRTTMQYLCNDKNTTNLYTRQQQDEQDAPTFYLTRI